MPRGQPTFLCTAKSVSSSALSQTFKPEAGSLQPFVFRLSGQRLQPKAYRLELFCLRRAVGPAGIALAGHLGVVAAVLADVVGGGEVRVVLVGRRGGTGALGKDGVTV